jgi:hypothetical protein
MGCRVLVGRGDRERCHYCMHVGVTVGSSECNSEGG